ncbi:MAG: DUF3892 domain-containing protein [Pseudomonadota bacterium]
MADVWVQCINKTPRDDTHQGITYLGGPGWKWTRQEVIASIKNGSNTFYTFVGGKRADVKVRETADGREYVQTQADGYWNDNLLALPECV